MIVELSNTANDERSFSGRTLYSKLHNQPHKTQRFAGTYPCPQANLLQRKSRSSKAESRIRCGSEIYGPECVRDLYGYDSQPSSATIVYISNNWVIIPLLSPDSHLWDCRISNPSLSGYNSPTNTQNPPEPTGCSLNREAPHLESQDETTIISQPSIR